MLQRPARAAQADPGVLPAVLQHQRELCHLPRENRRATTGADREQGFGRRGDRHVEAGPDMEQRARRQDLARRKHEPHVTRRFQFSDDFLIGRRHLAAIPPGLARYHLELVNAGSELVYGYEENSERGSVVPGSRVSSARFATVSRPV